ncbi:hypothetical protein J2S28_001642 [Rhizobium sp. SLBN-94]|nr:hypothetical protein [Rhizobium sp. SLBN-94]
MKQPRTKKPAADNPDKALRDKGAKWLARVEAAGKLEKTWLDDAKKASDAYTGESTSSSDTGKSVADNRYDFNILFANVETIVPAVINSSPVPDIRRRFGDSDPVARFVSELLERSIRVQIDDSRLQAELEAAAQDAFLAGRGIVRIRFHSDIVGGEPTQEDICDAAEENHDAEAGNGGSYRQDDESEPDGLDAKDLQGPVPIVESEGLLGHNGGPALERLENERISFEAVSWLDYRHGPAKRWNERPWEAFRFCIPREDECDSFDTDLIASQLSSVDIDKRNKSEGELNGWEIWDKAKKEVIFIDDDGIVLKVIDDPLGLSQFFCTPTPIQPIEINGRLMPVNPFSIYRQLADDLEDAVRRKNVLIRAMKARGWYGTSDASLDAIINLDDNEFAPIPDAELWAANGGLENAIVFWPFEKFISAIQQLDAAITTYKQWIYEITGISDIVRGASMASETATAQNIKSQWGSLRIQKMQRMMERCARDLFVMMSEIIPAKFSRATLEAMTEMDFTPVPSDAPDQIAFKTAVSNLLKRKLAMYYRIDVESDSTIRADLTRQKAEVSQFLQGAGAYFASVAPLVQQGALPADAAVEIFAATARMFNLGRTVEDTLEQMVTTAKQKATQAQQPADGAQQPTPEQQAAMAQQAKDAQAQEIEAAGKQQDMAQKQQQFQFDMERQSTELQMKMSAAAQEAQARGQKAQEEAIIRALEIELKQLELQKGQVELQIKQRQLGMTMPAGLQEIQQ